MAVLVQKVSVSISPQKLKKVDRLKRILKLQSRSAVFDYLIAQQEKKAFYEAVHQEALQLAQNKTYQKEATRFAQRVSKNFSSHILKDDGEDYSTW